MSTATWDQRFLRLAREVAGWSKDPSTKVGSVIVRPDRTIASTGYNGFPKGASDLDQFYLDRELKYQRVVHAEANALMFLRERPIGYTLYCWPLPPCTNCMKLIIQSGIRDIVAPYMTKRHHDRWGYDMNHAAKLAEECGLTLRPVDLPDDPIPTVV